MFNSSYEVLVLAKLSLEESKLSLRGLILAELVKYRMDGVLHSLTVVDYGVERCHVLVTEVGFNGILIHLITHFLLITDHRCNWSDDHDNKATLTACYLNIKELEFKLEIIYLLAVPDFLSVDTTLACVSFDKPLHGVIVPALSSWRVFYGFVVIFISFGWDISRVVLEVELPLLILLSIEHLDHLKHADGVLIEVICEVDNCSF